MLTECVLEILLSYLANVNAAIVISVIRATKYNIWRRAWNFFILNPQQAATMKIKVTCNINPPIAIIGNLASSDAIRNSLLPSPSMVCTRRLSPTPIRKSKMGAANHAVSAILASPFFANAAFAMTSPIAFPQASIVIAKKAGGNPRITPRRATESIRIPARK